LADREDFRSSFVKKYEGEAERSKNIPRRKA
jgi:hypothetical protein